VEEARREEEEKKRRKLEEESGREKERRQLEVRGAHDTTPLESLLSLGSWRRRAGGRRSGGSWRCVGHTTQPHWNRC
jgi:hypothetical protein